MGLDTVPIMLGVIGILVMLWGFWPRLRSSVMPATSIPDHDLADLKAGRSATAWRATERCPHCLSSIGHSETMTKVCLSCGRQWEWMSDTHRAAIRSVVIGGRWVDDLLIRNRHYTFDGKNWIPLPAPPHKEADGK